MREDKLLKTLYTDPERGMRLLMDAYAGLVYTVVRGRLSAAAFCDADVESCVADTFSEFYCALERYDPSKGSLRAWLCVIARRNALDRLRRHYREAETLSLDDGATAYADDFSLEGDFAQKEQRAAVVNAVQALGKPDREILVRKYVFSQSSQEIAAILHMTVSCVDTRAHRAIQKLRKQFGGDEV